MKMWRNLMTAIFATLVYMLYADPSGVEAVEYLFVQTATGAILNGTLTLTGVTKDVTYFSDRPVRVAGRSSTEDFLSLFEPLGTFSQDPPNGALSCQVDGNVTTIVITITAPVMTTDETGVMTLTYETELVSMMRGGPTLFDASAAVENVANEIVVCDDDSGVSFFIDSVGTTCPSPMTNGDPDYLPCDLGCCYAGSGYDDSACASGWTYRETPRFSISYCTPPAGLDDDDD